MPNSSCTNNSVFKEKGFAFHRKPGESVSHRCATKHPLCRLRSLFLKHTLSTFPSHFRQFYSEKINCIREMKQFFLCWAAGLEPAWTLPCLAPEAPSNEIRGSWVSRRCLEGRELSQPSTDPGDSHRDAWQLSRTFKAWFVSWIFPPFLNPPDFSVTFHLLVQ